MLIDQPLVSPILVPFPLNISPRVGTLLEVLSSCCSLAGQLVQQQIYLSCPQLLFLFYPVQIRICVFSVLFHPCSFFCLPQNKCLVFSSSQYEMPISNQCSIQTISLKNWSWGVTKLRLKCGYTQMLCFFFLNNLAKEGWWEGKAKARHDCNFRNGK